MFDASREERAEVGTDVELGNLHARGFPDTDVLEGSPSLSGTRVVLTPAIVTGPSNGFR